jgi:hypothetical protein
MSIYRLYIQNGNCAGFWIQHRTWQNKCAQVVSIEGRSTGSLPEAAATHAGGVLVQCFDVRSGRPVSVTGLIDQPDDRGFVRIAEPPWNLRSRRQVSRSAP